MAASLAALGLFLVLSNLAEPQHDRRLLLELILFVPLLFCSVRIARAKSS